MALMTFTEATQHLGDAHACFKLVTSTRNLALLPKYLGNINSGIRDFLDAELNLNSSSVSGVPIAYSNVRRLQGYGRIVDEAPAIHLDIEAKFIVFQPSVNSILKGVVNKISGGHVGCLVHGCFNASIPKPHEAGNEWPGFLLQMGEEFLFRVLKTNSQNGVLSMKGEFHQSLVTNATNHEKKGKKRKLDEVDVAQDLLNNDNHDDSDLPVMKKRKKHSRKSVASASDFLPLTSSTPHRSRLETPLFSNDQNTSVMDVSHVTDSDSLHKKRKKKKHKRDRESDSVGNSSHHFSSLDSSVFAQSRADSPDAPSDVTHDSGINSVDSDSVFRKSHKKSKKKKVPTATLR